MTQPSEGSGVSGSKVTVTTGSESGPQPLAGNRVVSGTASTGAPGDVPDAFDDDGDVADGDCATLVALGATLDVRDAVQPAVSVRVALTEIAMSDRIRGVRSVRYPDYIVKTRHR